MFHATLLFGKTRSRKRNARAQVIRPQPGVSPSCQVKLSFPETEALITFTCVSAAVALMTLSLRGVGVKERTNDVSTIGPDMTMAPLDRCIYTVFTVLNRTRGDWKGPV